MVLVTFSQGVKLTVTRADKITEVSKRQEFFSDFTMNLDKSPLAGSLARVINEQSVKASIKNLILTIPGERLFRPELGSNVRKILFEPMDDFTVNMLKTEIQSTINNFEPRAILENISIIADEANQSYNVNIIFSIINSQQISQLDLVLYKVR